MNQCKLPIIIQGGMGVGVSAWPLAKAVSLTGQLGVVSGTALDAVLVRQLQLGDLAGDFRRALREFPLPGMTDQTLSEQDQMRLLESFAKVEQKDIGPDTHEKHLHIAALSAKRLMRNVSWHFQKMPRLLRPAVSCAH